MKVLSIRQPWAWLIVNGHKDVENRTWSTKYRGEVLIHAGKGMTEEEYLDVETFLIFEKPEINLELPPPVDLQRGGIVGVAELVDCVTESESRWFFGPYGFVMRNARPLPFSPMRGALGFFNAPADFEVPA